MIPKNKKTPVYKSISFSALMNRRLQFNDSPLPNALNPVVFRDLKRSEIDNIPKERYFVIEITPTEGQDTLTPTTDTKKCVVIRLEKPLEKFLKSFNLNHSHLQGNYIGGEGGSSHNNIFVPPIREDKMAECILGVMDGFFHGEDKCTICYSSYSYKDFCVLMHIYFKYIGILKNENRLPYSTFLKEKVFGKKSLFSERTYNTYATKDVFLSLSNELKNMKDKLNVEIDFTKHPQLPPKPNENIYKPAFQEIGWAFQQSDYFVELRELRKNLQTFNI
jgi:hypothetical protein